MVEVMQITTATTDEIATLRAKADERDRLFDALRFWGVNTLEDALKYIDEPYEWDDIDLATWCRGLADADLNLDELERSMIRNVVLWGAPTKRQAAKWLGIGYSALRARLGRINMRTVKELPSGWDKVRGGKTLDGVGRALAAEALRRVGSQAGAAELLGVTVERLRELMLCAGLTAEQCDVNA